MRTLLVALLVIVGLLTQLARDATSSARTRSRSRAPEYHLPADYEPIQQLIITWDDNYPRYFVDIAAAAAGQVDIVVVVDPNMDRVAIGASFAAAGIGSGAVEFLTAPIDSMWLRDFGPLVVRGSDGSRRVVDLRYFEPGADDELSARIAQMLWPQWPVKRLNVALEGGNLLADGTGRCVTTALPFAGRSRQQRVHIRSALRHQFGCRSLVVLDQLDREATGHVDVFAIIPGPGRIVVGAYEQHVDRRNARILDRNARLLRDAGFSVGRIPMPGNGDDRFRTYTNAVPLNGVVLAPVYGDDRAREAEALAVLAAEFPGRRITPIDATDIIELHGAVHCTTMTVAR
jgi:agmatine deiminase